MPHIDYWSFPPPPPAVPANGVPLTPAEWAKSLLEKAPPDFKIPVYGGSKSILDLGRKTIALFKDFPPEYVDYYKALQVEIAEKIPEEQDRPLICLVIKGNKRRMDNSLADVGMAGGTGPLSDATALENLVRHMSKIGEAPFNDEAREVVAEAMQNFSGVMYSMPPPRDAMHGARDAAAYLHLYKRARKEIPCTSLHILTNTGHSRKSYFGNDYLLGNKKFGDVDDMTVRVAHRIQRESKPGDRVLVLGTTEAAKAKLYPNLLINRNLEPILPTGDFGGTNAQTCLQKIIDQAKANKINDNMPGEARTCGQAFVDFAVAYAKRSNCSSLLFSCTELPMLLHTKIPNSNQTYIEKLEQELNQLGLHCNIYDTEKLFVEEIAKKSTLLQDHPEMRSNVSLRRGGLSHYHLLHNKLDVVKEDIIKHCHSFINTNDEVQLEKRDVLMATLQFFEDGDREKLDRVIAEKPRYADATLRSNTLALVTKGKQLMEQLEAAKEKMDSFKEIKEQFKGYRKKANAKPLEENIELQDEAKNDDEVDLRARNP